MKVMLVDDYEPARQMLKVALQHIATEFLECADGGEAVACYAAQRPDWVLMDIGLPKVDGLVATRQITSGDPHARVIIVTQYDGSDLRQAAREAGACAYVRKQDVLEVRELIEARTSPVHPEFP